MKIPTQVVIGALLLAGYPAIADKTDLSKEKYVEASEADFAISLKVTGGEKDNVRVFEVAAPTTGTYTLLCFVDGRCWANEKVELPTKYSLSVRGLTPGKHKVTIQVVDKSGRVGSKSHQVTRAK